MCRRMTDFLAVADIMRWLRRPPLPHRVVLVAAGATLLTAVACAQSRFSGQTEETVYRCDNGVGFVVSFESSRARVVTRSGVYVMEGRKASFGRRYSSHEAAFAQDEDRGVLIGAVGGPFRNCVETANTGRSRR